MGNQISHSRVKMYGECGKKYYYYYVEKLRERHTGASLLFGSAIDKAIGAALEHPDKDEVLIFNKNWEEAEINGKLVKLPKSTLVNYGAKDFDPDILTLHDWQLLQATADELGFAGMDLVPLHKQCLTGKKQQAHRKWPEIENIFFNFACWLSLRRKGHLMLQAHRKLIMPKISKVYSTQKRIELKNPEGDTILGYIDAIVDWKDEGQVVFDYKTSSPVYEEEAVLTSPQLALYCVANKTVKAGYIVFLKEMIKDKVKICSVCSFDGAGLKHKTCPNELPAGEGKKTRCGGEWAESVSPRADVQVLVNEIPPRLQEIVMENLTDINQAIKAKHFPRNFSACHSNYGPCAYLKVCFKNDYSDIEAIKN